MMMHGLVALALALSPPVPAPTAQPVRGGQAQAMVSAEVLPVAASREGAGPGDLHRHARHRRDPRAAVEFE